jgi:hypothetical protein
LDKPDEQRRAQEAMNAIHDTAVKALETDSLDKLREALELIVSISRYGQDIRTEAERR